MELQSMISAFAQLGKVLGHLGRGEAWPGEGIGLTQAEYEELEHAINTANISNGWFTLENVRYAFNALSGMLDKEELESWTSRYQLPSTGPKKVGLVMAGNIPMVGFHDLLCVLLSGHKAVLKLSSEDNRLLPAVLKVLFLFAPALASHVEIKEGKLGEVDAVIATGSNNSARYFEHYFGKLPHIIRKNRNAVAVLTGEETDDELEALGEDIFRYFGLGCRNVSKMFVPASFDLDRFFGAVYEWHPIGQHTKYANNYDYHKALWLMDGQDLIENGFLLLKEDEKISSPVGSLFYERYEDAEALNYRLKSRSEEVQCIIGRGHVPFGKGQHPRLDDYADGVDTMAFLSEL